MITTLLLFLIVDSSLSQFCASTAIPHRLQILSSSKPLLGCATADCFGNERPARTAASCTTTYYETSCAKDLEWVGGLDLLQSPVQTLAAQCCHYRGLKFSTDLGKRLLHRNEIFQGGKVFAQPGRLVGFDLVSDIDKDNVDIGGSDETVYKVRVRRMNCIPRPPEEENLSEITIPNQFDSVAEGLENIAGVRRVQTLSGGGNPSQGAGARNTGRSSASGSGASAAAAACFWGNTTVRTPNGPKLMTDLEIGDAVLTIGEDQLVYSPVTHFLHRVPEKEVVFHEISIANGQTLTLTGLHLLYAGVCGAKDRFSLQYAKDLEPMVDCLLHVGPDSSVKQIQVKSKRIVHNKGIFNPVTSTGTIVTNDILSSCYAVVKDTDLLHTVYDLGARIDHLLQYVFGYKAAESVVQLPSFMNLLSSIIDTVLITDL